MNFENKNFEQKEKNFNPEILIGSYEDVKPSIYFSALENLSNNDWEDKREEEITEKTKIYLESLNIKEILKKYKSLKEKNDNVELLNWFAHTYKKSEKIKELIILNAINHKDLGRDNVIQLMTEFDEIFDEFMDNVNIDNFILPYINENIKKREKGIIKLNKDLKEVLTFFQIKEEDIKIQKYIYLPTNPLYEGNDASGNEVGEIFYINAKLNYRISEIHEFLHSFINPITDSIEFTEEEKEKIIQLSPERLVKGYKYPKSILNEMLIRTFKTGLKKENSPFFEAFKERVLNMPKEDLQKQLELESERDNNQEVFAKNVDDLFNDEILKKYYNKYSYNEFEIIIWDFYQDYAKQEKFTFNEYLKNNYKKILN